ncbi:hypothetical protein [Pseudoalteromonas aurantia]|uniref:Uncharacterized protein n=1 Tax=Pseudoalteromonas aurantia TaxID=43654 RepID=A0A5S3V7B4_9GAMM|nr:hypothetical protein [Pseudoalteromonas aurantia]TMO54671.1 hypothetical protein CWC18_20760 [Pseudoalteromonas aurantia]TMO67622.1 hypothetical protein CWC19_12830 [Pseudoalteromonas aurantia]TMO78487.1 hypothetical protein CWC20_01735 [Pseudoalteromonas aurantia]
MTDIKMNEKEFSQIRTINESMKCIEAYLKFRRRSIEPLYRDIDYIVPHIIHCESEALRCRFLDLMRSTYYLYKEKMYCSALISLRSALETLAVLLFLNKQMRSLVNGNLKLELFLSNSERFFFSFSNKSQANEDLPKAYNIQKFINETVSLKEWYDKLSEYAHPNYSGAFGIYAKIKEDSPATEFEIYARFEGKLLDHIESGFSVLTNTFHNQAFKDFGDLLIELQSYCQEKHRTGTLKTSLERAGMKF